MGEYERVIEKFNVRTKQVNDFNDRVLEGMTMFHNKWGMEPMHIALGRCEREVLDKLRRYFKHSIDTPKLLNQNFYGLKIIPIDAQNYFEVGYLFGQWEF